MNRSENTACPPKQAPPTALHNDPSICFMPNGQCVPTTPPELMNQSWAAMNQAISYSQSVASAIMNDNFRLLGVNRGMALKMQELMGQLAEGGAKHVHTVDKVAESVEKAIACVERDGYAASVAGVGHLRQLMVELGRGKEDGVADASRVWAGKDEKLRLAKEREEARIARQADELRIAGLEAALAVEKEKVDKLVAQAETDRLAESERLAAHDVARGVEKLVEKERLAAHDVVRGVEFEKLVERERLMTQQLAAQQEKVDKLLARDRELKSVRDAMREELTAVEGGLRIANAESVTLNRRIEQMTVQRKAADERALAAKESERIANECACASSNDARAARESERTARENERGAKREVLAAKGEVVVAKRGMREAVEKAAEYARVSIEAVRLELARAVVSPAVPAGPCMAEQLDPLILTVVELQAAMRAMAEGYAAKLVELECAVAGLTQRHAAEKEQWMSQDEIHRVHVQSLRIDLTRISDDVSNMAETLRDIVLRMDEKMHVICVERCGVFKSLTNEVAGVTALNLVLQSDKACLLSKVDDEKLRSVKRVVRVKAECEDKFQADKKEIQELKACNQSLSHSLGELMSFYEKIRALIPMGVKPDEEGTHIVVQEALRMILSSVPSPPCLAAAPVVAEMVRPKPAKKNSVERMSDVEDDLIKEMMKKSSDGSTCSTLVVDSIKKTLHRFESSGVISFGPGNEILLDEGVHKVKPDVLCVVLRALITSLNAALQYGLSMGDMSNQLTRVVHESVDIKLGSLLSLMDQKKKKKDPSVAMAVQTVRKFVVTYNNELTTLVSQVVNVRLSRTKAECAMSVFTAVVKPTLQLE